MTQEGCALIEEKNQLDFSPEQVSGWLSTEKDLKISHERIYQYVWVNKRQSGKLFKHLRHSNKKRRKAIRIKR
jgi:IS30 family transposase